MPQLLVPYEKSQLRDYDATLGALRELREAVHRKRRDLNVQGAWEQGKMIDTHVLFHQKRAKYAEKVIKKFADALGENPRQLYYSLQFARSYPILQTSAKLGFGHFQQLLTVSDQSERDSLTKRAAREGWTVQRLKGFIKSEGLGGLAAKKTEQLPRLVPKRGKLWHYRIEKQKFQFPDQEVLMIDLGLKQRAELAMFSAQKFELGSIIEVVRKSRRGTYPAAFQFYKRPSATKKDLYTYKASVEKVIDADTFWLVFHLGFGQVRKQKVRLRGIDAPERKAAEGQRAKKFVEALFEDAEEITVTTSRVGKFDRYIADVFLGDIFLNQLLLDEGHATRVPY